MKEHGKQNSTCIDQDHGDRFLLHNREADCVYCLLMMERHHNAIQYKAGYCVKGKHTLHSACRQLRVEDILYTLIRENSEPVECPFTSAYHFSYNNNTAGFCEEPKSYVRPCASASQFYFQFHTCPDVPDTYEKELKFQCLATWKDGSETFIYGGFTGPGMYKRDDRYRCFKYQSLGADVNLAMSADASCRGLRSPSDGPLVMKFQRDTTGWPQEGCVFPDWMRGVTWEDLSGRHLYTLDAKAEVLRMIFRRKRKKVHTQAAFRCLEKMEENSTKRQFVAITLTSHGCETSRQCIRVLKRDDQVLEIHRGPIKENSIKECLETDILNQTRHHLVIPKDLSHEPCPISGKYVLEHAQSECQGHLQIGCNGSSVIGVDVGTGCKAGADYKNGRQLECLKTWKEGSKEEEKLYIIARRLSMEGNLSNCFLLERYGDKFHLSTDRDCNLGAPYFYNRINSYSFTGPKVGCSEGSYEIEAGIQGVEAAEGGGGEGLMREGTKPHTSSSTQRINTDLSRTIATLTFIWTYCHLVARR